MAGEPARTYFDREASLLFVWQLRTKETDCPRIYLDNAATSWPKPESVYTAVDGFQRNVGASAGRGGYKEVVESMRLVAKTSSLMGSDGPSSHFAPSK